MSIHIYYVVHRQRHDSWLVIAGGRELALAKAAFLEGPWAIVMASIVMAYIVMVYIAMALTLMAFIVVAL